MKVSIRQATKSDIPEIVRVEQKTWPEGLAAEEEKFDSRINTFPEGVLVATHDEKIVGVVVVEIISVDFSKQERKTWYELTDNGYIKKTHNINGNVVFGVDLSVTPELQNLGIATKLLEEIGKMAIKRNIPFGMLGGRMPGYYKFASQMAPEEYLFKKNTNGEYFDPEVNFYSRSGLEIKGLIPNYFRDPESLNYGVSLLWKNPVYMKNRLLGKMVGNIFSFFFKI